MQLPVRFGIRFRVVASFLLVTALFLLAVGAAAVAARRHAADGALLQLATRQTLLAARLESAASGLRDADRDVLERMRATARELEQGQGQLWARQLHAEPSPRRRLLLERARAEWLRTTRLLERLLATRGTGDAEERRRQARAAGKAVAESADVLLRLYRQNAELLAEEEDLRSTSLAAFLSATLGLGALLGVVSVWGVLRSLAPLLDLERAASRIASGDLDVAVAVEGRHEVARLSFAFNEMAASVARARRSRERRFQSLLEAIPDIVCELGRDGRCRWLNPAGAAFFRADRVGQDLGRSIAAAADAGAFERVVVEALEESRRPPPLEGELRREDGEQRRLSWSFGAVWDDEGRLSGALATARDVTALHQTARERSRLALAVEQCAEIVFVTDTQGTIEYVNPAFEAVTGYSRQEALGANPRLLRSGRMTPEDYRAMWDTVSRGEVWRGSLLNRTKSGSLLEIEASVAPLVDHERATTTHYVAVQRDVTGLRRAQKLEALGELVASIGHEISNPANFIMFNLPILQEAWQDVVPLVDERLADDPERRVARLAWSDCREELPQLMTGIQEGIRRVRQIVDDLRAFVRSDEGAQPVTFSPSQSIATAVALSQHALSRKGAELVIDLVEPLPRIRGVPAQLEQVVVNLLLNAAAFVPETNGRIVLSAGPCADGASFELTVEDDGPGVDPEVAEKVFEPFFTRRDGGTGLGLAISARIARTFGGELRLETHSPRGARFRLVVPVTEAPS